MAERKALSASLRWSVFYRDGFACRYCGAQAGENGVEIQADHVVSVADGGDNRMDNLVTACRKCNGGKGARSVLKTPTKQQIVDRVEKRLDSLYDVKNGIIESIKAKKEAEQQVVNLKCSAYQVRESVIAKGEMSAAIGLIREFGPDRILQWYSLAYDRGVSEDCAIQYVCGIARNVRCSS